MFPPLLRKREEVERGRGESERIETDQKENIQSTIRSQIVARSAPCIYYKNHFRLKLPLVVIFSFLYLEYLALAI